MQNIIEDVSDSKVVIADFLQALDKVEGTMQYYQIVVH